jgi:hypothetical protein
MKFGLRIPSLSKRLAARTSWRRYVRHSLGVKAPRGWGLLTHPHRAVYNRIYRRTTVSADQLAGSGSTGAGIGCAFWLALLGAVAWLVLR